MLSLHSAILRAHRSSAQVLIALGVSALILAACSSDEGDNKSLGASTTTTTINARLAADPIDATLDPNRTTTTAPQASTRANPILHVLGSIRSITDPSAAWQSDVPVIGNDLVTVASLGCAPTAEGCGADEVTGWSLGGVDLLNVATAEAATAGEDLRTFVVDVGTKGLNVLGYGPNEASAVNGLTAGSGDSMISLHAISLRADATASAGAVTAGIAGPASFDALLEEVATRHEEGLGVVVVVDVGSLDDRSPTPEQIDSIQQLVDAGVDAVIGHGSDFIQRFDRVGQSTVAYSLGNAVIDTPEALRADSALLRLEFGNPGQACLLPTTATAIGPLLDDLSVQGCR